MDCGLAACLLVRTAQCLAVDRDHIGRGPGERGNPAHKAALELLCIESCEDVAQMIVRWRACLKRPAPAQKLQLLVAEAGNVDECLGTRQHPQQSQKQYLLERIHHLRRLASIGQIPEMLEKHHCLAKRTARRITTIQHKSPLFQIRGYA